MAKIHHIYSSWKHINRRHMGHIAHLIIQFKSVNTFAQAMIIYHIIEKERKKPISFLRTEWSLFEKPRVPFTQGCFVSSLVEIGLEVLERIFIFLQYIMLVEVENVESLQTDGRTTGDQVSSLELSAQVS